MDLFKPVLILPFQWEWKGPVMDRAGQFEVGISPTCLEPKGPALPCHSALLQAMGILEAAGLLGIYGSLPKPLLYGLDLSRPSVLLV